MNMRASSPRRRRAEDGVPKPGPKDQSPAGATMKAITVYQPWATLIVVGAKPYEFRGWNPRERGEGYASYIGRRHVIHAAARKIVPAEVQGIMRRLEAGGEEAAAVCLLAEKAWPVLERALVTGNDGHGDLPWSAGVGTAELGEPRNGLDIAAEFGMPESIVNDSERREHALWGWPMLDPEEWDMPVPCRGLQGFWGWPTPETVGL